MVVDRYTKTVLTVIAVCLVWLAFGGSSTQVHAQLGYERVVIAGWVEETGTVRPLPAAWWSGKPAEQGKPGPSAALPIWNSNP